MLEWRFWLHVWLQLGCNLWILVTYIICNLLIFVAFHGNTPKAAAWTPLLWLSRRSLAPWDLLAASSICFLDQPWSTITNQHFMIDPVAQGVPLRLIPWPAAFWPTTLRSQHVGCLFAWWIFDTAFVKHCHCETQDFQEHLPRQDKASGAKQGTGNYVSFCFEILYHRCQAGCGLYCAGFPCKPFSFLHSKSKMLRDKHSKPLFQVVRHIKEVGPAASWLYIPNICPNKMSVRICFQWMESKAVLLENVYGFKRVWPKVKFILDTNLPQQLGFLELKSELQEAPAISNISNPI